MQKISLKLATPGMKLARPVENDRGMTLCGAGTVLSEDIIERLSGMEIKRICVEGHPVDTGQEIKGLSQQLEELDARFQAEFDGNTSVTIGNFYSVVEHLAAAIEQAGSIDSAKVRDVYYSGTFVVPDTCCGDLEFNEMGLAIIPPVGLQWMGGERKPVWPPAPDIWKLKWIPPWDER